MTLSVREIGPGAADGPEGRRAYVWRHVVSFEETNVVGNVYFARHVAWQGSCRESFLRDHVPDILGEFGKGLRFVTVRVACEYFEELFAFDSLDVRMRLAFLRHNRLALDFEYQLLDRMPGAVAAIGSQELACMRLEGHRLVEAPWPPSLVDALRSYGSGRP